MTWPAASSLDLISFTCGEEREEYQRSKTYATYFFSRRESRSHLEEQEKRAMDSGFCGLAD
jgi:hypothetical protein